MIKKKFEIFTQDNFKFIPSNVIIVKDVNGWMFMSTIDSKWYVNSTQDGAKCPDSENEKFLKQMVKAIKDQIKMIKGTYA